MKECTGIPMGQIWCPDPTVSTLTQKGIKVTSLKELEKFIDTTNVDNLSIDYTNLEDIDDTMDMDLAKIGLIGCDIPDVPEGYKPSDYDITQTIQKALQLTEAYLKQEDNNATYN